MPGNTLYLAPWTLTSAISNPESKYIIHLIKNMLK